MDTKNTPLVWIVIPTRNRSTDLIDCITSIKSANYNNYKILVVDNNSDDGTIIKIKNFFPEVFLLKLEKNHGASFATNQGFKFALDNNADYVLRLDSDTILDKNYLTLLINSIQSESDVGIASGSIYYYDQPEKIWFTGGYLRNWDLNSNFLDYMDNKALKKKSPIEVDLVPSTGMLISSKTIEVISGFDEDYFVYYEDFDFCARAKKLGIKILYVPSAKMWHKIFSNKKTSWTAENWNKSKMIFYRKHAKNKLHLIFLIFHAFSYALFRAIFPAEDRGNRGPLLPALSGLFRGLLKQFNSKS